MFKVDEHMTLIQKELAVLQKDKDFKGSTKKELMKLTGLKETQLDRALWILSRGKVLAAASIGKGIGTGRGGTRRFKLTGKVLKPTLRPKRVKLSLIEKDILDTFLFLNYHGLHGDQQRVIKPFYTAREVNAYTDLSAVVVSMDQTSYALKTLCKKGLIEQPVRCQWQLTEQGKVKAKGLGLTGDKF